MNGTIKDYLTAIGWMLDKEGVKVTSAANHRMLKEGKITLEAFQAAARVISERFLKEGERND